MKRRNKLVVALAAFLVVAGVYAGTNTLSSVSSGVVRTSHINQFFTALTTDVVPRNSSGAPTTNGGSLGSSTYKWLKAWVASGGWVAGDVKLHHTYNGTQDCGHGWMLADGRQITAAAYNTEHGANTWATYVVSSPLENKYLPDMTGRYPVGAATTTQTGAIAITAVGNSGNTVNLQHNHGSHTHTITDHQHVWMTGQNGAQDQTYTSGGAAYNLNNSLVTEAFHHFSIDATSGTSGMGPVSYYTANATISANATTPSNGLSTTQSIQPDSISLQYCMRVID